jgi:hypothetical protein
VAAPRCVELNKHVLGSRRNTTIHLKKEQKECSDPKTSGFEQDGTDTLFLADVRIRIPNYVY